MRSRYALRLQPTPASSLLPCVVTMSYQDDLSQLMPTIYSQVRLAANSDSTANILQYAKDYQLMGSPFPTLPSSLAPSLSQQQQEQHEQEEHQQQKQKQTTLQQHTRKQQGMTQTLGTGRMVACRPFNLELR